jgi:hypothetical protein
MSDESHFLTYANVEEKYRKLKENIKFLNETGKNASKICDNHLACIYLYKIYQLFQDEAFLANNSRWKILNEDLCKQIVDLWSHMAEICEDFDTKKWNENIEESQPEKKTSLNQRRLLIFKYLIEITYTITQNSSTQSFYDFNKRMFDAELLKTLLVFYKRKRFINKSNEKYDVHIIMIGITGIVRNLSEMFYAQKNVWIDLKVEKVLQQAYECKYAIVYSDIVEQIIININQKSIKESIDYLLAQSGDSFEMLKNRDVYNTFLFISKQRDSDLIKNKKYFKQSLCVTMFAIIFDKIYEKLTEIDLGEDLKIEDLYPDKSATLNQRILSILKYMLVIIQKLVKNYVEMNKFFSTQTFLHRLVLYSRNFNIIKVLTGKNEEIVELLVTNLSCFSVYSIENKKMWQNLHTIDVLFRIVEKFEQNSTVVKQAFNCIGFILTESQIGFYFEQLTKYVQSLLDELGKVSHAFKNYKRFKKYKMIKKITIEILNEKQEINKYEVSMLHGNLLTNTLNILINFALNSKMKKLIFKEIESIKMIILKGYFIERYLSLKILAQLCFDEEICLSLLNNETKFIGYLQNLLKNTLPINEQIKSTCENILFSLNIHFENENSIKDSTTNNNSNRNIMISFYSLDSTNQSIFLEIKNELEKYDYKILNDNTNSIMNISKNMRLIEQSNHVLVFLCEKYRLNENCQLEAKHAFKLKKQIIGVVVQNNFDTMIDGWIQSILPGENNLVIYNKKNLKNVVDRIKKELESYLIELSTFSTSYHVEKWTSKQVENWLFESQVHPDFIKAYGKLDGFTLKQLYLINYENPQLFHKCILSEMSEIKISDLSFFFGKLKNLYGF